MTLAEMVARLREDPADADHWSILADFLEELGWSLFVVTQEGVYRHRIVGIFRRFDKAMEAAVKEVREEHDHYHNSQICHMEVDDSSATNEHQLVEVSWVGDDDKMWSKHNPKSGAGRPKIVVAKTF